MTVTGRFTIVYDSTLTVTLTTCASCTAILNGPGYGLVNLDMENSAGPPSVTSISLQIGPGVLGATYAVVLELLEGNLSLAPMYQGVFGYSTGASMNVQPGACVTFSSLDLSPGAVVSGSVDCDMKGSGVNNDQVTPHISGTFSGQFPN